MLNLHEMHVKRAKSLPEGSRNFPNGNFGIVTFPEFPTPTRRGRESGIGNREKGSILQKEQSLVKTGESANKSAFAKGTL